MTTPFAESWRKVAGSLRVHRDWLLTPHRAALHEPTGTAVIADLHLGYDRARRRAGEAVPALDLEDTVASLTDLFASHSVRRLVVAGDLVENRAGSGLAGAFRSWLAGMGVELTAVVPGNHDRGRSLEGLPCYREGFWLRGWQVVHGDGDLSAGHLVLGHFHPCLRWGHQVWAACYLVGARHIILPAFSRDAKGVNVIGAGRWRAYRAAVIVGREVLDFGRLKTLDKTQIILDGEG